MKWALIIIAVLGAVFIGLGWRTARAAQSADKAAHSVPLYLIGAALWFLDALILAAWGVVRLISP